MANDRNCASPTLGRDLTPRGVVFTGHLPSSGATDALVSIECTLQGASIGLTDLMLLGLVGGAGEGVFGWEEVGRHAPFGCFTRSNLATSV